MLSVRDEIRPYLPDSADCKILILKHGTEGFARIYTRNEIEILGVI